MSIKDTPEKDIPEGFGEYQGPGLYRIGKHGIVLFDLTVGEMDEDLMKHEEDEEYEDSLDIHDPGEDSLVYVEKFEGEIKNSIEDIFEVRVINATGDGVTFDSYHAKEDCWYTATDHSLFGSGYVFIEVKGKMEFKG